MVILSGTKLKMSMRDGSADGATDQQNVWSLVWNYSTKKMNGSQQGPITISLGAPENVRPKAEPRRAGGTPKALSIGRGGTPKVMQRHKISNFTCELQSSGLELQRFEVRRAE
jgi:hypothetical protein